MLLGYDFEVFKYNWLVVFIDPFKHTVTCIWDNQQQLEQFHKDHCDMIYCGYHSRFYDEPVMQAILCGFDAWKINEWLVKMHLPGYKFSKELNKIKIINYDTQPSADKSLKQLEAFQGHNIKESDIDFNIDRPLTEAEKREVEKYCINDVMETLSIFSKTKEDFNALLSLIKMFQLPFSNISKTKAQNIAKILECVYVARSDTWDLYTLPCLNIGKYQNCVEWFFDKKNQWYKDKNGNENPGFNTVIAGVMHSLGFGGIHGAVTRFNYKCKPGEMLIHVDVESYYPSLMIEWNLLTRNAQKSERYKYIKDLRLKLKHEGKKKEQAPLKIVINGTFGICNDPKSAAYDPRNANLITINGQLLLIDLIDKLEAVDSFQLIQSNTDGLIIKIKEQDFEAVDDICYEWETRTHMKLGFDYITKIYQGDVNNYLFQYETGEWERKGAYVKELSELDNDLPIVNKAICDYLMYGIPVEETVNNCTDYVMFQKVVKLTGKYTDVEHNGKLVKHKCNRVFASADFWDKAIYKIKENGRKEKFACTPDNCYIDNSDIRYTPIPDKLNKKWYINLAKDRLLKKFGVN